MSSNPELPFDFFQGLSNCFEFAAYTPPIARALYDAAQERVRLALDGNPTGLEALSERLIPTVVGDGRYEELLLIPSFTDVVLCTEEGDEADISRAVATLGIADDARAADAPPPDGSLSERVIRFEYHGWLRYSYPACLLQPNSWDDPGEPARVQIARMLECIRIAHVFLGTLEAFEKLFLDEIRDQVDGYVRGTVGGRDPRELNELRTLALAVVNLTNFNLVAPTDEDHRYFMLFDKDAFIQRRQDSITRACETVYNVQVAEVQEEFAKKQGLLNSILFVLASLTLVSVSADAYNFVRENSTIVGSVFTRVRLMIEFVLAIAILAMLAIVASSSGENRTSGLDALLTANWWAVALRGLFAVSFGLALFLVSDITIPALALLFAGFVLVNGLLAIVIGIRGHRQRRWSLLILEGAAGIIVGAVVLLLPGLTEAALAFLLAVWGLLSGGLVVGAAYNLAVKHGRWWMVLSGGFSAAWGLLLFLASMVDRPVLSTWLSAYGLGFGVLVFALALRLRSRRALPRAK